MRNIVFSRTGGPALRYFVAGAGGDLSLPGAIEMQHLHFDGADVDRGHDAQTRLDHARATGMFKADDVPYRDQDSGVQRLVLEMTPPSVGINFVMSDLTWENGPIRQIPGSHTTMQRPPKPEEEPEWMRFMTLVGAPAGAAVFRDHRCWHSGTPNLSKQIRCLPGMEYVAPWTNPAHLKKSMPYDICATLTPHGQEICRHVRCEPGVWPEGAGVMHPLGNSRRRAIRMHRLASAADIEGVGVY